MTHAIYYTNAQARLFITLQADGKYIGSILYREKQGSWSKGEEIVLDFHVHSFFSNSEPEAKQQALQWFKDNIDKDCKIV